MRLPSTPGDEWCAVPGCDQPRFRRRLLPTGERMALCASHVQRAQRGLPLTNDDLRRKPRKPTPQAEEVNGDTHPPTVYAESRSHSQPGEAVPGPVWAAEGRYDALLASARASFLTDSSYAADVAERVRARGTA